MKIGFTGTQRGMTIYQQDIFVALIRGDHSFHKLGDVEEFHHGDCIGSDEESHEAVRENFPDIWIKIHPPVNPSKRAWCEGDEMAEEKDYLSRNHDIVNETDILVATPSGSSTELRSGTWATIRYALKDIKPVYIIHPIGYVEEIT